MIFIENDLSEKTITFICDQNISYEEEVFFIKYLTSGLDVDWLCNHYIPHAPVDFFRYSLEEWAESHRERSVHMLKFYGSEENIPFFSEFKLGQGSFFHGAKATIEHFNVILPASLKLKITDTTEDITFNINASNFIPAYYFPWSNGTPHFYSIHIVEYFMHIFLEGPDIRSKEVLRPQPFDR